MTPSHHPRCWYKHHETSSLPYIKYKRLIYKEDSEPSHCYFTNHLKLFLIQLWIERRHKKREIKRRHHSSTQSALGCVKQMQRCTLPSCGVRRGWAGLLPPSAQGTPCPQTGLEYWCRGAGVRELQSGRPRRNTPPSTVLYTGRVWCSKD